VGAENPGDDPTGVNWVKLWPNSNWYQPLLSAVGNNAYYPYTEFDGVGKAAAQVRDVGVMKNR